MTINHFFAGIPVADYTAARAWYERLFGRPPDVVVAENESMWQVADKAWIYVVGDATRAGRALVTMLVNDLDAQVAELSKRGLETSAIETVPGAYRKAMFTDPEGNMISFGEVPNAEVSS